MRITCPYRGWAALVWPAEADFPEYVVHDVQTLAALPGVKAHPGRLEVPANLWKHQAWQALMARVKVAAMAPWEATYEKLWEPKRPLKAHQESGARFLVDNGGGLLADPMGLGKTTTAITAAETIALIMGSDRPRLVIGPAHTRPVWKQELLLLGAIDSGEEFTALMTRTPGHQSWNPEARWWFIHYDVVAAWSGLLAVRGKPVVAILDELHWIKNGRAKRSRGAAAAAGVATVKIGLTGTPLPNRPSELWHPLTVLCGSGTWGSPVDFRVRYAGAYRDNYGYRDTGPTNVPELRERLGEVYLRREIDEVGLDLPELTRQPLLVELGEADRQTHDELVADIGHEDLLRALIHAQTTSDVLRAVDRLRKLTGEVKLKTTVQYVTDALDQGEPVVVFCWQRRMAEKIASLVNAWAVHTDQADFVDQGPAEVIHGGVRHEDRELIVQQFQEESAVGCLVATLDSLKEGVTLDRARLVVLHDLSWVPSDILQAEARIRRLTQRRPCLSTWVLAEDSIDTLLARVLITKAEAQQSMLGLEDATQAADELDLLKVADLPSVEDEARRLLDSWIGGQL